MVLRQPIKKPPEDDLPGVLLRSHHWKILKVSQHTSPERLARVMVMMMVELNACHSNSVDEWIFICVGINLTKMAALGNTFLTLRVGKR